MRQVALVAVGLALAAPAPAAAARFAVGVGPGVSSQELTQRIEAKTGRSVSAIGSFALTVNLPSPRSLAGVRGVAWVERVRDSRRLAFTPNDPLVGRQWYLNRIHAFDAWPLPPTLANVKVAVIDSGIDADHPELHDQIAAGHSFVASSWQKDTNGHGTFVAGEIAASLNNGQGIAGIAFPAQLLIAKVVRADGTISPEAEARAIRWSVLHGAQVINLSFGGVRDPLDPTIDTYSPLEAAAVAYAVSQDVLVVAAVGNSDNTPGEPWGYAGYPAALPHVLGVSAIARDGSVPSFSNRDAVYNDIAAPGEEIFSTLPRALTATARPGCVLQGYSDCGPVEFRHGQGTSFAAPQVSAAAALLLATYPQLQADQVSQILTGSATDAEPSTGCKRCPTGRDSLTGWGVLNIAAAIAALSSPLPQADHFEPDDGAGSSARRLYGGKGRKIQATIDYWNDPIDVYSIYLRRGQLMAATLRGPRGTDTRLLIWKPGTRRVEGNRVDRRLLAAQSPSPASVERLGIRAPKSGWYYLEVKSSTPGGGGYTLTFTKHPSPPRAFPH